MADSRRAVVVIERLEPAGSGVRRDNGKPWQKFLVHGRTVDGDRIAGDAPVYTFDLLPAGTHDLIVAPYKNGESFTLKLPTSARRKRAPRPMTETAEETLANEQRPVTRREFERLSARVNALEALYESLPTTTRRES